MSPPQKKNITYSSWVGASKFSSWVSEPYHLMFKELRKRKKQNSVSAKEINTLKLYQNVVF